MSAANAGQKHEVRYVRGEESSWTRIGRYDSARRRSLWCRLIGEDGMGHVQAIELCSGREGDDAYVRITPEHSQWEALCDVLLRVEGDCGLKPEEGKARVTERRATKQQKALARERTRRAAR